MNFYFLLTISFCLISSCLVSQNDINDKLWRLEYAKINNKQVYFSQDEMSSPNILFYNQKIRGNSGCNAYHGHYEIDVTNYLKISSVMSSKMACSNSLKLSESDYIAAIQSPMNIEYQRDIQILTLINSRGDILRFFLQGEKKK